MRQQVLLGTAQWGLDYGITNLTGRLSDQELQSLISRARQLGVGALDTAPAYGDAQLRIGEFANACAVQTKVSASGRTGMQILQDIDESRRQLGLDHLWRVLVHDWPELNTHERSLVVSVLDKLRESGVVDAFGISIYTDIDLTPLPTDFGEISVIQIPVSIVDQRLRGSKVLMALREQGVVIQARSIFLQGILLDGSSHSAFHPDLEKFQKEIKAQEINALDACVSFIRAQEWIDEVVVGVTTAIELERIHESLNARPLQRAWEGWASTSVELLDPRTWLRD